MLMLATFLLCTGTARSGELATTGKTAERLVPAVCLLCDGQAAIVELATTEKMVETQDC